MEDEPRLTKAISIFSKICVALIAFFAFLQVWFSLWALNVVEPLNWNTVFLLILPSSVWYIVAWFAVTRNKPRIFFIPLKIMVVGAGLVIWFWLLLSIGMTGV